MLSIGKVALPSEAWSVSFLCLLVCLFAPYSLLYEYMWTISVIRLTLKDALMVKWLPRKRIRVWIARPIRYKEVSIDSFLLVHWVGLDSSITPSLVHTYHERRKTNQPVFSLDSKGTILLYLMRACQGMA